MSQIKEMLIFAAGLIITVALIMVGITVFGKAMDLGQMVSQKEEQKLQALKLEEIEKYEGQDIPGNKIVSYVRNLYGRTDAVINITGKNSTGVSYTFKVDSSNLHELRDENSRYFINPIKKYRVTVIRDKNDSITGIDIKEI